MSATYNGVVPQPQLVFRLGSEQRMNPRIYGLYPAIVRSTEAASGQRYTTGAILINLSASGAYLLLGREVEKEAKIFVVVRLAGPLSGWGPAPRLALAGRVLRTERIRRTLWGVGMRIQRHRFLGDLSKR